MTSTSGVMPLTPGLRAEPPDRSPSMGHSLLSPSPSRSAGSLGDGADLFAAGLAGHERVEQALRAIVGGDDRVLRAIYFGNWQYDFSQFIPEWIGEPWCPRRLGRVMFSVCSVLARHEFGHTLERSVVWQLPVGGTHRRPAGVRSGPRSDHLRRQGPAVSRRRTQRHPRALPGGRRRPPALPAELPRLCRRQNRSRSGSGSDAGWLRESWCRLPHHRGSLRPLQLRRAVHDCSRPAGEPDDRNHPRHG